jgi:hypothetical protein
MYSRLSKYLPCNNILVPEQFGFKKDSISAELGAYKLTDNVLNSIN